MSQSALPFIIANISTIWILMGVCTICFVLVVGVKNNKHNENHNSDLYMEENGNKRTNTYYSESETTIESIELNTVAHLLEDVNEIESDLSDLSDLSKDEIELSSESETSDEELELSYSNKQYKHIPDPQHAPILNTNIYSHDSYFLDDHNNNDDNNNEQTNDESNHIKTSSLNTYTIKCKAYGKAHMGSGAVMLNTPKHAYVRHHSNIQYL